MSHSNGKIQAPVDLVGDVAAVLGVSTYDVAYLCGNAHNKINPASKIKPIRHDSLELLPAELVGSSADNGNGIFYGVKIANASTDWTKLHDSVLTYYPPVPGTNWCRLTDFNGYDHNAEFNPQGTLDAWAVIGHNIAVTLDYSESNTTGVNVAGIIKSRDPSVGDIKNYYPCVLVSNQAKTQHFMRALNRVSGTLAPAPSKFYVDNSYYDRWEIPMDDSAPSILKTKGTVWITIFFSPVIPTTPSISSAPTASTSRGPTPWRESWRSSAREAGGRPFCCMRLESHCSQRRLQPSGEERNN